jgi:hypothetical protein
VRTEEPLQPVAEDVEAHAQDLDDFEEDLDEAPILDAIFENPPDGVEIPDDLDAFWDSAVADLSEDVFNADVLTYDQALQLGLTPDDDVA